MYPVLWFLSGAVPPALVALVWRARFLRGLGDVEKRVAGIAFAGAERPVVPGTSDFASVARELDRLEIAHEALKRDIEQQRFNLRAILASMVEGVVVTDTHQVIRLVNDSFRAMFSCEGDPAGQTVLRATRQADLSELIREAATGEAVATREIAVAQPGSHVAERFLSLNAAPMRDARGAVTGVVAVLHDVSRLRQLEEVRRQFVANVSHELRTPLSIFQGYLETLMDSPRLPKEAVANCLRIMAKHSGRLQALLDDLLILARLESRSDALDLEPLELKPFLEGILSEWAARLHEKKVVLEIDPAIELIPADPFRLEQVIGNLLENAIKYSSPGDQIAVRARREGECVELRIEDSGTGIPPADLPRVFERFYRVEKARSRDAGGTGLGLSIVKHIIGLHGGEVHAESVYGQGTAIVIHLPAGDFPLPEEREEG